MAIVPHVHRIHEALEEDDLYDSIENSLFQMGLGNRFAVYFKDPESRGFEFANSRNLNKREIRNFGLLLQQIRPAGGRLITYALESRICFGWLVFQGKLFGAMMIPLEAHSIDVKPESEIENLFRAIGSAIVKLQLIEQSNGNDQIAKTKIDAINRIAGLLKNLDLETFLANLLQTSLEILDADVGAIVLREEDGAFGCRTEMGLREELILGLKDRQGRSFIESMMQQADAVLIRDAANDARIDVANISVSIRSLIWLPLSTQVKQFGAIVIVNNAVNFEADDLDVFSTIGHLASAAIENALLRIVQVKAERIKEQMSLAREIQGNMQAKKFPVHADFDIDGWCIPCDETGGDYFDFIEFDSGQIGVVVGDATGHGIAAALTMVAVRASLLTMIQLGFPLTDVFHYVNNRIEADGNTDRFMTLFCGMLNPGTKTMNYCSAGHDSPFWYRPSTDQIVELESTGIPIGMFSDWKYDLCENVPLQKGDILVISTDGVREGSNKRREAFGNERFRQLIRESAGMSATEISNLIRVKFLEFIDPAPRTDDVTVVVVVVR